MDTLEVGDYVWRTYPDAATRSCRRGATIDALPVSCRFEGAIVFRTRTWSEVSEPVFGEPENQACYVYREGTVGSWPCPTRGCRVRLQVRGLARQKATRWHVVVNERVYATLCVGQGQITTVSFDVWSRRDRCQMTLSPADVGPQWAEIAVTECGVEEIPSRCRAGATHVFILGDSTAQTYTRAEYPQGGWGEFLARHLNDSLIVDYPEANCGFAQARCYCGAHVTVHNRALGARSIRSYDEEGRFDATLRDMRCGDLVLIQFGLNEATAARPMRHVDPSKFGAWLDSYVAAVRARQGRPVIVTSPPQHGAGDASCGAGLEAYAAVARATATRAGVDLIDLRALAGALLRDAAPVLRDALYMQLPARQYPRWPGGLADTVHLTRLGARVFARIVAGAVAPLLGIPAITEDDHAQLTPITGVAISAEGSCEGTLVIVTWRAVPGAEFYCVERCDSAGRRIDKAIVYSPQFIDRLYPLQRGCVAYRISAGNARSISGTVTVRADLPIIAV